MRRLGFLASAAMTHEQLFFFKGALLAVTWFLGAHQNTWAHPEPEDRQAAAPKPPILRWWPVESTRRFAPKKTTFLSTEVSYPKILTLISIRKCNNICRFFVQMSPRKIRKVAGE